jgi:hypothetical protein
MLQVQLTSEDHGAHLGYLCLCDELAHGEKELRRFLRMKADKAVETRSAAWLGGSVDVGPKENDASGELSLLLCADREERP